MIGSIDRSRKKCRFRPKVGAAHFRRHEEQQMLDSSPRSAAPRYELRFTSLFDRGRGYAFPCDAQGCVALDLLSECARNNYFYARAVVGMELSPPGVLATGPPI
ncbi:hypothetical protein [Paucibacter sp. M5-1]|uniref:hypothetical protein n=1 Tax=Paucibacter sp. M5-1 TaxID=3015998 RepID=UPI002FCDEC6D